MRKNTAKKSGFTLIELMMTIAIGAIVLTLGVPGFTSAIRSNRMTTNANELVASLNLARSEAIKRGLQVTIERKGATKQVWENGWDIFVDINGDGNFDDLNSTPCETNAGGALTEDCLLRTYYPLSNGYTLRTGANYACWIAFTSDGSSRGSGSSCTGGLPNDTFRLCDESASTTNSRSIATIATGRVRTSEGTASCP